MKCLLRESRWQSQNQGGLVKWPRVRDHEGSSRWQVRGAPGGSLHAPSLLHAGDSGDAQRHNGCHSKDAARAGSASGCSHTHHLAAEQVSFLPLSWEFKRLLSSSACNQLQGQANTKYIAQVTAYTKLLLFKNKQCLPGPGYWCACGEVLMSPTSIPAALGREESTTPQTQVPDKREFGFQRPASGPASSLPPGNPIPSSNPSSQIPERYGLFGGHREEGRRGRSKIAPALWTSALFPFSLRGRQKSDPEFPRPTAVEEVTCHFAKGLDREILVVQPCWELPVWILRDDPLSPFCEPLNFFTCKIRESFGKVRQRTIPAPYLLWCPLADTRLFLGQWRWKRCTAVTCYLMVERGAVEGAGIPRKRPDKASSHGTLYIPS